MINTQIKTVITCEVMRGVNGTWHHHCLQMMQKCNDYLEHRKIFETKTFENHNSIASKLNIYKTLIETFIL